MKKIAIRSGLGILTALAFVSALSSSPALAVAHASFGSGGGSHSSGGHSGSHSSYHSSYHSGGHVHGWGSNASYDNYMDDGMVHYYDPGHPVQTGAQFSGPSHIDPTQYHYFVQTYDWSNNGKTAITY